MTIIYILQGIFFYIYLIINFFFTILQLVNFRQKNRSTRLCPKMRARARTHARTPRDTKLT